MAIEVLGAALKSLSDYIAEKGLDHIIDIKASDNREMDVEQHVYCLLSDSLEDFCKKRNIEFDENAILETCKLSDFNINKQNYKEQLKLILERATGMEMSPTELELWIEILENNLVSSKHEKLFRAIQLKNLKGENDTLTEPAWMQKYMADNFIETAYKNIEFDNLLSNVKTELPDKCWIQTQDLITELALNAFSHGKATQVILTIKENEIMIRDDGSHFDTKKLIHTSNKLSGGNWTIKRYIENYSDIDISYGITDGKNETKINFNNKVFSVNDLCEICLPKSMILKTDDIKLKYPNIKAKYYYIDFTDFDAGRSFSCMSGVITFMGILNEFCKEQDSEIFIYLPDQIPMWDDVQEKIDAFTDYYQYSNRIYIVRE